MELIWIKHTSIDAEVSYVLVPKRYKYIKDVIDVPPGHRFARVYTSIGWATDIAPPVYVNDPADNLQYLSSDCSPGKEIYQAFSDLPLDDKLAAVKAWCLLSLDFSEARQDGC